MKNHEASPLMRPIAIVGVSALFPGSTTTAGFWRDILEGKDRITDVPRTHWLREDYFHPEPGTPDKVYSTRGGFLSPVEFSPLEFGMPPNSVPATDTAQLLGLVIAKRVLEDATRGRFESVDRSKMSVILGVASATELVGHMCGRLQRPVWEHAMRSAGLDDGEVSRVSQILEGCYVPWQESTFPGLLGNVVAGRITNRLDLGGTNAVVDAACAGSLAAIEMAANDLALGHSDLVVTGGVDALNDILMFMCFAQTGALSPSGDCRPFSDQSDGTILGEGIGMLALRRLEDAERDGDAIYAVIRGIGSSSDGKAKSIYAPSAAGQTLALNRAYARAGYGPETVGLVEAHGTGTRAGDLAEVEALRTVFHAAGAARGSCALGSVKAQIGHTKASAGAAGMIKAVLSLHHKVLPPTIKVRAPNPELHLDESPFYLNTETRPWIRSEHPRRASVSALGFGGTNFHVALEEYTGREREEDAHPLRLHTSPSELLLLTAESPAALIAACASARDACTSDDACVHMARAGQLAFDDAAASAPVRLALVCADAADARDKLGFAAEAIRKDGAAAFTSPRGIFYSGRPTADGGQRSAAGEIALLFPGQGSQYIGMGADLAMRFDCVRDLWDGPASGVGSAGERLADRVFPRPVFGEHARSELDKRLTATEWAQPGITATSLAMLRLLAKAGVRPAIVGGHSLGEISAAVASGMMDEATGLAVARRRGELMANASSTPGSMTAVAAERDAVTRAIAGVDVVVANHNSPKQIVLSGKTEEIDRAERALEAAGLATRRLPVSTAFHSPLVAASVAPFRAFLEGASVSPSAIPCFANATAAPYPADPVAVKTQLAEAIVSPVRFVDEIEAMYGAGARTFIEVGPDAVLTKLTERILDGRPHTAVALDHRGKHGVTALLAALGRLAVSGVPVSFAALWEGEALPEDPATRRPAKFSLKLCGANHGKPYPPPEDAPARPAPRPVVAAPPPAPPPPRSAPSLPSPQSHAYETQMHAPMPLPTPAAPVAIREGAPVHAPLPAHGASGLGHATHAPPGADASFVDSLNRLQAPAIAAQMEFQRLMVESHMAFLRTVETAYVAVTGPSLAQPVPQVAAPPRPYTNGVTAGVAPLLPVAPAPALAAD